MPALPESAPGRCRKPNTLSRWFSVTTTTSPRWHSRVPSYSGDEPDRLLKPPPWSHTITGRRPPSSTAGVQTLATRQSSDIGVVSPGSMSSPRDGCGQRGP